jgi:hypothetical protein
LISFSRYQNLASQVEYADLKVDENDFFRLEQKLGHVLYLMKTKQTQQQFVQRQVNKPEHQMFTNLKRWSFFICESRLKINPVLDARCEQMVLSPNFFQESVDFQTQLQRCVSDEVISLQEAKQNPLYRSIGHLETL